MKASNHNQNNVTIVEFRQVSLTDLFLKSLEKKKSFGEWNFLWYHLLNRKENKAFYTFVFFAESRATFLGVLTSKNNVKIRSVFM